MEVLVVEDEAAIREVEVAYLRQAGYTIREAANGKMALTSFKQYGADLIIVDLNLPGVNGLEVCRSIRSVSLTPVIIVTAQNSDEDELHGLEAGADDYIKKPFNPQILVARVDRLLRRHGNKKLVHGELTLEPQQMAVSKNGVRIPLTTTRFNLLLALASQPNTVFTRSQLINQMYDDPAEHEVYDRTIDAHIKNIRKAIEDDPAHPRYIHTVVGKGYCFRETRND